MNSRLLPVLIILVVILQLFAPYDGWTVLLVGLGGAWLGGYLWARCLSGRLSIRREIRYGWTQVGDLLEERFTLINQSFLPGLWVEVVDYSTMPDYQVSRVTGVAAQAETQWHIQSLCSRRGLFIMGPTTLRTADPLGIYTLEIHDSTTRSLMVTPPIVPLPTIEVARGGHRGEGRPRPNVPERVVSAAGVREYLPGDSIRHIHWLTSARMDRLFVRLFEGIPAGDWWIVLDLDRLWQSGQGQDSTEEHSVILAASLADRGLRLRKSVGIVSNSKELVWLPPQRGESQRWEILRTLALVSPGESTLAELLARMKSSFGKQTSLILVTPNVTGDWIKELIPHLWVGTAPTVLILDPASFGGIGDKTGLQKILASLGIRHYIISRDLLDQPEARPGATGHWEWRISATGRAIPVNRPADQAWRSLT